MAKPVPKQKPKPKKGGADGETPPAAEADRKLIITLGDISDIDGIMALRYYAENIDDNTDIAFVMNYPAYLREDFNAPIKENEPGLGYTYGLKAYKETSEKEIKNKLGDDFNANPRYKAYQDILTSYKLNVNPTIDNWKNCLRDIAYMMCKSAFIPQGTPKNFYFIDGGINSINPFNADVLKNEIYVYANEFKTNLESMAKNEITYTQFHDIPWNVYTNIYMDMNGSAAFLDDKVLKLFNQYNVGSKLHSLHVMGGVYDDKEPTTMSAIQNVLNRFSYATMNQLYFPEETKKLFDLYSKKSKPIFIISNNIVNDSVIADKYKNIFTFYQQILTSQSEDLSKYCKAYYDSIYNPPKKPFDIFTAISLVATLTDSEKQIENNKHMFFQSRYGATLISNNEDKPDKKTYLTLLDILMEKRAVECKKRVAAIINEAAVLFGETFEHYNVVDIDINYMTNLLPESLKNSHQQGGRRMKQTKSNKDKPTHKYTRTDRIHIDKRGNKRTVYTYKGKDYIKKLSSKTMKMYYSPIK